MRFSTSRSNTLDLSIKNVAAAFTAFPGTKNVHVHWNVTKGYEKQREYRSQTILIREVLKTA